MNNYRETILAVLIAAVAMIGQSAAFAPQGRARSLMNSGTAAVPTVVTPAPTCVRGKSIPTLTSLAASENDDIYTLSESSQSIVGAAGTLSSLIVFYSEYTLKTTGCGVPAGPFGIFGLAEGVGYLVVFGLVAYSAVTKAKTGSGLPAGPGGLLGAAEGLSYLALLMGVVVLVLQVTNYGYIPNAVPMEGGMCS